MKAAVFKEQEKIAVEERPDPEIQESTDAVVRVVRSCVCGSDLWFYRGESPYENNSPIGHEFIGVVEKTGDDVKNVSEGDLVIAPFTFSDGTCAHCSVGATANCVNGGLWGTEGIDGAQGQYVRSPFADGTLVKVPEGNYSDDMLASLLTLSDVMCTGHHAAVSAGVKEGDTVAVVGDGAVGLSAVIAAKRLGAERIIALSSYEARQKLAKEFGATDIVSERGDEAINKVMELTDNVGVDAALECVGKNESVQTALKIARPGSRVGYVGLPHGVEVPVQENFFRNVGMQGGPAHARTYMDALIESVLDGTITPGKVFDYETDLENVADAYDKMDNREAVKALLKVSEV